VTDSPHAGADTRETSFFFVHIMKTGGRTLVRHFRENFELDEIYPYGKLDVVRVGNRVDINEQVDVSRLLAVPEERRRRVRVYSGHYPYVVCELLPLDLVTMTVLRDPVERTISMLRELGRTDSWTDPNASEPAPMAGLALEQVYEDPKVFEPLILNHQTKIFAMNPKDPLGTYMDVVRIDEARLGAAKDNLAKVDLIGSTENYGDFLHELSDRYGWRIQFGLRKNVTPTEGVEPVSKSFRSRIADDNAIDIEFYEYATNLIESRRRARSR
jgi:hypothetical protein